MTGGVFQGIRVASGIAVGRAFLLHAVPLPVVPNPVPPERLDQEVERLQQARQAAQRELDELKGQIRDALGQRYAGILDAQKLILDDPALIDETCKRIRVGRVSARWALKEVVAELSRRFTAIDDEYIRERGGELADVHFRLQRLLRGERPHAHSLPDGPLVIVAHELGPSDALLLARRQVVGLVTDVGGRTSHTAILAQALGLPAVVGLHDFSQRVRFGDTLIVDGEQGRVTVSPDAGESARAEERRSAWLALDSDMASTRDLPAVTQDGVEITLRANIEFPTEVESALRYGARGIGLYRSEFLFLSHSPRLPSEEEHYRTYRDIAESVAPEPAVIRTLDVGGEKYFHEVLDSREGSPVMGLRAIRLCLRRPDIFLPQLRGLLRAAAAADNIRVLLPLVVSLDEIREVRRLLSQEATRMKAEGFAVRADFPLGIMIEVPAAALAADVLAREADFLSIGTNDLIQYALAVDRSIESVSYLYQPLHPGVLRMLQFILRAAQERAIPVAMCGEMAADVEAVGLLVGLGLRELSVQPRAVATVRQAVRHLHAGQMGELAAAALSPCPAEPRPAS